jgi:hypothetical protein
MMIFFKKIAMIILFFFRDHGTSVHPSTAWWLMQGEIIHHLQKIFAHPTNAMNILSP